MEKNTKERPNANPESLEMVWKKIAVLTPALLISGCSLLSATGLRCGTDGDSSYVELVNVPQDITSASRYLADLCSFAYDSETTFKIDEGGHLQETN